MLAFLFRHRNIKYEIYLLWIICCLTLIYDIHICKLNSSDILSGTIFTLSGIHMWSCHFYLTCGNVRRWHYCPNQKISTSHKILAAIANNCIWLNNCIGLTHWVWMRHICVSKLYQHWFRYWLVAWLAPSHYLNKCWDIIVNWAFGNKFQWNSNQNQNTTVFISEHAFENVVWNMAAILSRPQCVNKNTCFFNFVISAGSADSLEPQGVGTSADTMMAMFGFCTHIWSAPDALTHWPLGDLNEIFDV